MSNGNKKMGANNFLSEAQEIMKRGSGSQEALKKQYHYNPETGAFINNVHNPRKGVVVGIDAGTVVGKGTGKARRYVYFANKRHPIGNLIVLYMTGTLPQYIGYTDGNASNLKYNNIYTSQKRVCVHHEKVGVKTKTSDRTLMVRILELMDASKKTKAQLYKASDIPSNRFKRLMTELVAAECIVFNSDNNKNDVGYYSLTSNGHCRVIEMGGDKHFQRLIQFYTMMPNLKLPLNNMYGDGLVVTG